MAANFDNFLKAREAINSNDPKALKLILESDPDIVLIENKMFGTTLLHEAVYEGNPELVKLILLHGADPNKEDKYGHTPIHMAIVLAKFEVIPILIIGMAKINFNGSQSLINYLIEKLWEKQEQDRKLIEKEIIKCLNILLENGLDINTVDSWNGSALHIVAKTDFVDFAQILLSNNLDININNEHNETPLHVAARNGKSIMVRFLLNNNADPRIKDKFSLTPLHKATLYGNKEVIKVFIDKKVYLNDQTEKKYIHEQNKIDKNATAVALAEIVGKNDIALLLKEAGGKYPPNGLFSKWEKFK